MTYRLIRWLLALALAIASVSVHALEARNVRLPDGEYTESAEDLRVKVMGGYVTISRTWLRNRWWFNPAWAPLTFEYDLLDNSVKSISRAGWQYKLAGPKISTGPLTYAFDQRNTILSTATGWRWQNRDGDWIEYDKAGRVQRYGDRNDVQVSFSYDSGNRMTGVLDHFGKQVLWFEYAGDQISAIRDYANRRASYLYTGTRLTRVTDVRGYDWNYEYDAAGRLTRRTDPEGRVRVISYGSTGRVSSLTEPDGTRTAYGYEYDSAKRQVYVKALSAEGRTSEAWYDLAGIVRRQDEGGQTRLTVTSDGRDLLRTDAAGNTRRDELDEWDNLVRRVYPDGSAEVYEREPRFSRVTRYVDPNGNETRYEYDTKGNLVRLTEAVGKPESRATEFAYDAYGNQNRVTRLADAVTLESTFTYQYDDSGNLKQVTDPEGNVSRYTYDVRGSLLSLTDGRGKTWRYDYDAAGKLVSWTDPLGQAVTFEYDKVRNLVRETDARGNRTRYEYDERDRLTKTIDALGNAILAEYDRDGSLIKGTDERGNATQLQYDAQHRPTLVRDARGNTVRMEYPQEQPSDAVTGPSRIAFPTYELRFKYDSRQRIVEELTAFADQQRPTRYTYDRNSNRIAVTGADGKSVRYDYDALDRRIKGTDTLGNVTLFAYDDRDNLIALTDPQGRVWRFAYDRSNRLMREVKPLGQATEFAYDAADNLVSIRDAKGQRIDYEFDDAERIAARSEFPAGAAAAAKRVTYRYDTQDNLVGWDDGSYSATRSFDALNRLSSEVVNYGAFSLAYGYSYHPNGLKQSLTYPGGATVTYDYDRHNVLNRIDLPGEGSITVNQFNWLAPTQVTFPGGSSLSLDYDGQLMLTGQKLTSPAQLDVFTLSQRYGSLSQVLERTLDGSKAEYAYDDELRLTAVTRHGQLEQQFSLDAVQNRIADSALPGDWEYDDDNRLLRQGDTLYEYDDNGNLVRKIEGTQVTRYVYDTTDRLVQVQDGSGNVIARYGYDPFGRRLWKQTAGEAVFFLYSDEGLIGEYDSLGQETKAYGWLPDGIWGTDPAFLRQGQRYFYYQNDHLGTPHRLVDRDGAVVWTATYSAFGQATIGPASTVMNNLRLPGQYFDQETGLHQNWLRYYEPRTGRYTQYDPMGVAGSMSGYAYTDGSPIDRLDPRGDWFFLIPVVEGLGAAALEAYAWGYVRCLGTCGLQSALVDLVMAGCVSPDTLGDCAKDCAMPWNWFKPRGVKAVQKVVDVKKKARALDPRYTPDDIKDLTVKNAKAQGREFRRDWLEVNEFDPKQPRHVRGWLEQERNLVEKGRLESPRTPPGYVQGHGRETPAREGFDYSNARLQGEDLNKLEESVRRRARRP